MFAYYFGMDIIVLTLEIKKKKPGLSYQILKVSIFHSE